MYLNLLSHVCVSADKTKNFSGAEIQGLVKSAISWALNRQIDVADLSKPVDEENIKVSSQCHSQAPTCYHLGG